MGFAGWQLEAERRQAERQEAERLEVERREAKRLEAERLQAERLHAETALRAELDRVEAIFAQRPHRMKLQTIGAERGLERKTSNAEAAVSVAQERYDVSEPRVSDMSETWPQPAALQRPPRQQPEGEPRCSVNLYVPVHLAGDITAAMRKQRQGNEPNRQSSSFIEEGRIPASAQGTSVAQPRCFSLQHCEEHHTSNGKRFSRRQLKAQARFRQAYERYGSNARESLDPAPFEVAPRAMTREYRRLLGAIPAQWQARPSE